MSLMSFFAPTPVETLEQLELEKGKMQLTIMKMVTLVLSSIMLAVVFIFLIGMFMPNELIDTTRSLRSSVLHSL